MSLFDEKTLRQLEQLTLVANHVRVGLMKGDRRSQKRGSSIEFADYRNYVKGDDLRRLDWNVYARLERPFIKLLEEEEDLAVHLLVDASESMDWPDEGDEPLNKLTYALRLAGALGHIALMAGDQLYVTLLNQQGAHTWGPVRGQQNSLRLFQFLEAQQKQAGGLTDLNVSLREYALRGRRPGLLFLFSDMLSPEGYLAGLNGVQSRGYEVGLFHLLSPDEVEPPALGDVKLVDSETGLGAEITLDAQTRVAYKLKLQAWQEEIAGHCHGRGIHYLPITTDESWEKLILNTMRRQDMLR
jgi:uncharacterized protein (DUF58 family)